MKNHIKLFGYLYPISAFLISTSCAFAAPPLIATGNYFDGLMQKPLLAMSQDQGDTWKYPQSIVDNSLPQGFSSGGLGPVVCQKEQCVAGGSWYDQSTHSIPLLALSNNSGFSWDYLNLKNQNLLPENFYQGWFNSVSCSDTFCFAGGYYKDNEQHEWPLLFQGNPGNPLSWSSAITQSNTIYPEDFDRGWFNSVSCVDETCIAAGVYQSKTGVNKPLLILSNDNGKNWDSPSESPNFHWPKHFNGGSFYASSCHGNFCVAAGEYTSGETALPFLIYSKDKGKTWAVSHAQYPKNLIMGYFTGAACNLLQCVVSGVFSGNNTDYPLLAYMNIEDNEWTYPEFIAGSGLPNEFDSGNFMSATCSEKACMAAGVYYTLRGAHPLIAVSQDGSPNWHYPASAQQSNPLSLDGDGMYNHISCNNYTCLAVGDFLDTTSSSEHNPLLAVSKDNGATWYYPESINNRSLLPENFLNGHFTGSN